jgi:hypothetical protein
MKLKIMNWRIGRRKHMDRSAIGSVSFLFGGKVEVVEQSPQCVFYISWIPRIKSLPKNLERCKDGIAKDEQ